LFQSLHENISGQIYPNKDHFVVFHLVFAPWRTQIAAHQLVNTLENHFSIGPLHVQDPFVAQHFGSVDVDDGAQKVLQLGGIKRAIGLEHKALDVIIMVVMVAVLMRGVIAVLCVLMIGMLGVSMLV
jgi:hypothetical protein